MKHLFITTALILSLITNNSFAQMGHGMMRHMESETEHRHMMEHEKMMENMMGITQDISIMMHEMSEIVGKMPDMSREMSRDRMHKMATIMRDLCTEINNISEMMDRGMGTEGEMDKMRDRITEMQKKMSEMQMEK